MGLHLLNGLPIAHIPARHIRASWSLYSLAAIGYSIYHQYHTSDTLLSKSSFSNYADGRRVSKPVTAHTLYSACTITAHCESYVNTVIRTESVRYVTTRRAY